MARRAWYHHRSVCRVEGTALPVGISNLHLRACWVCVASWLPCFLILCVRGLFVIMQFGVSEGQQSVLGSGGWWMAGTGDVASGQLTG